MQFTKMHGAGNDYVYVDCFAQPSPANPSQLAIEISHRRFGVGADGLILIEPSKVADARMRMFNADGSESEMCGNGIRCVAKFVHDHGICSRDQLSIETGGGLRSLKLHVVAGKAEQITVDMGQPQTVPDKVPTTLATSPVIDLPVTFGGREFRVTCVSMGNPHCVIFVPEATDELVLGFGPQIEKDPRFPRRTNVEFVEVISRGEVRQRTWERGSGETWACGTGASAVCAAGVLTGRTDRKILNHLVGGDLQLHWDEASQHIMMTGGAVEIFTGQWNA